MSEAFCHRRYNKYHPQEYNKLFNYLYSFASSFTVKSRGALAIFLLEYPNLAVPLYNYRKNFNPKAFTKLIESMNVYKSFNEYIQGDEIKYITKFFWEVILLQKITLNICDNKLFMYLYHGYTYTVMQRFFLLSTSKAALKKHIDKAFNIYKDTYLLLNEWKREVSDLNFGNKRKVVQMSSIKAMEKFHDLKTEEVIEEQRVFESCQHSWDSLSAAIKDVSPEWYLPEYTSDIRLRGQQHHNCVGGYIERHFKHVEDNYKMLLLFTDFYEAELHLFFKEIIKEGKAFIGCIEVKIQQVKTTYNNNIPGNDLLELKKIIKVFINLPVESFNPSVKKAEVL